MREQNYWTNRPFARRQVLRGAAVGGLGAGAWALVGCSADDADDSDSTEEATSGSAASPQVGAKSISFANYIWSENEPTSVPEPQRGGKLISTVGANVPHLDPTKTTSYAMHAAGLPTYNGLLRPVYAAEGDVADIFGTEITGDLAESWELSQDQLTYTFALREASWQNVAPLNGRGFIAEDVVYALDYWRTSSVKKAAFDLIQSVEAPDDKTVVVTLSEPNVDFLNVAFADVQNIIFSREVLEEDGNLETRAIGTGPFIQTAYNGDVRVLFERNPDYFRPELPYIDELELQILVDPAARLSAFRSGQLDVGAASRVDEVEAVLGTQPGARAYARSPMSATWMFNTYNAAPPFDDPRVRQALSMAINRGQIIDIAYRGQAVNLPPMPWPYIWDSLEEATSAERLGPYFEHNPEEAKKLLDAAGYGDGFDIRYGYYVYNQGHTQAAELFQQHVKAVGINVNIESMEYTAWSDYHLGQGFGPKEMAGGFHSSKTTYLDEFVYNLMYSESPQNVHYVNDPEMDKLILAQRREFDPDARREILQELWALDVDRMYRIARPEEAGSEVNYISERTENAWPTRASLYPTFGSQQAEIIFLTA